MRNLYGILVATALVWVLAGCKDGLNALLFESSTTTTGSFRGLKIGATKEQTVQEIAKLGVRVVQPRPLVDFEIGRDNISELARIESVESIRVMNYAGLSIDLRFDSGTVAQIRKSYPARNNSWFKEGDSVSDVKSKLADLLSAGNLVVFPIVFPNVVSRIDSSEGLHRVLIDLKRYDAWTFELTSDRPAGARVELYFTEERLARIEYRRARVRLD